MGYSTKSRIAYYLWGVPALTTAQEGADSFSQSLQSLRLLVDCLVRAPGFLIRGPEILLALTGCRPCGNNTFLSYTSLQLIHVKQGFL